MKIVRNDSNKRELSLYKPKTTFTILYRIYNTWYNIFYSAVKMATNIMKYTFQFYNRRNSFWIQTDKVIIIVVICSTYSAESCHGFIYNANLKKHFIRLAANFMYF